MTKAKHANGGYSNTLTSGRPNTPQPNPHPTPRILVLLGIIVVVALFGWGGISLFAARSAPTIAVTPTTLASQVSPTTQATSVVATVSASGATDTPNAAANESSTPTPDAAKPLAGHRIGIDPGHGPRGDMGAVSINSSTGKLILAEADFTLDVAQRCRDILVARGAEVVLTRENADTFTSTWPNDANGDGTAGASGDDLQTRVDIINDFHAEAFLSIHANSLSESKAGEDLQIIYCGGSDCAFPDESKRLGDLVLKDLVSSLADAGVDINKGAVLDDLAVDSSNPPLHMFVLGPPSPPRHVRSAEMPGILGETLYVSQPVEAQLLLRSDVRQAIALGYANALQEFLTGSPAN